MDPDFHIKVFHQTVLIHPQFLENAKVSNPGSHQYFLYEVHLLNSENLPVFQICGLVHNMQMYCILQLHHQDIPLPDEVPHVYISDF